MKNWLVFEIEFNDCSVISRVIYETPGLGEKEYYTDSYSLSRKLDKKIIHHKSLIRWMKEIEGKLYIFDSQILSIEEKTLHLKILIQKKGKLLVNSEDFSEYKFDLDFLRKPKNS